MSCNIDKKLEKIAKTNEKHDNAHKYDETLFDLQSLIAHELDDMPKGKLLDAGAAYGTLTKYLKDEGWDAHAIDAMPELWNDWDGIPFEKVNLETDDIPWDGFDVVLFTEVIEHLNYNPVPVVEKLYKATAPGGLVICTTPMKELQGRTHPNDGRYKHYLHYKDIPLPWNGYTFVDDHHYFYLARELAQLFHEVGYEIGRIYPIRNGHTHFLAARKPDEN